MKVFCALDPARLPDDARATLREALASHEAHYPDVGHEHSNLVPAAAPLPAGTEVVLGQPDPEALLARPSVRWVHLTSAGYARYAAPEVRDALRSRGTALTTSSRVYAEPCAEQLLAAMLATVRRLPETLDDQRGERPWRMRHHRDRMGLLEGARILVLGYGAIGRRLVELLAPFRADVTVVRRRPTGQEPVPAVASDAVDGVLGDATHVVSTLPGTAAGFLDAARIGRLAPGAYLYNVGRGTTVDQDAVLEALERGRLAGAYLDVTDPEPLPPEHPLWGARGALVTPHVAGGQPGEMRALMACFADNLRRWMDGEPLIDRVL